MVTPTLIKISAVCNEYIDSSMIKASSPLVNAIGNAIGGAGLGALYGGVTRKLPGESRLRRVLTSAAAGGAANGALGGIPVITPTLAAAGALKGLLSPKREGEEDSTKKNVGRGAIHGLKWGIPLDILSVSYELLGKRAINDLQRNYEKVIRDLRADVNNGPVNDPTHFF